MMPDDAKLLICCDYFVIVRLVEMPGTGDRISPFREPAGWNRHRSWCLGGVIPGKDGGFEKKYPDLYPESGASIQ